MSEGRKVADIRDVVEHVAGTVVSMVAIMLLACFLSGTALFFGFASGATVSKVVCDLELVSPWYCERAKGLNARQGRER